MHGHRNFIFHTAYLQHWLLCACVTRQSWRADLPRCATCRSLSLSKIWLESMQYFRVLLYRRRDLGPWCENMASSTKLEVHNVSQRRRMKTEPRQRATCVENLVKFGLAVFEICERTHRQTEKVNRQYFAPLSGAM